MAKQQRRPRRARAIAPRRPLAALRPVAWSAVVGAAFAVVVTVPAFADPAGVPDPGTKPLPSGVLRLPGATPATIPTVPPVPGPLANQIMAAETALELVNEQVNALTEQLAAATPRREAAEREWRDAADRLAELQESVNSTAERAYKSASVLEPFGEFGAELRGLGRLVPPTAPPGDPEITPWDLARAEAQEQEAKHAYDDALLVEQGLTGQKTTLEAQRAIQSTALNKLRQTNAAQLARVLAEQEAYEQSLAGRYGKAGTNVHGEAANPKALEAVRFALKQLGKPYEWGAEGPYTYDCSGLVWAAYKLVGTSLPRVANDQYTGTTPITVDKLLPGDLVFFATDRSDWRSIHHVGIYLGDNKMVHAPTTGDVVRISPVWWSRFFGAARVLPAVPAASPSPSPSPSPSASTSVQPSPSRTPSAPPSSPSPSPSPSPSSTPSPSPSPSSTTPTAASPEGSVSESAPSTGS